MPSVILRCCLYFFGGAFRRTCKVMGTFLKLKRFARHSSALWKREGVLCRGLVREVVDGSNEDFISSDRAHCNVLANSGPRPTGFRSELSQQSRPQRQFCCTGAHLGAGGFTASGRKISCPCLGPCLRPATVLASSRFERRYA